MSGLLRFCSRCLRAVRSLFLWRICWLVALVAVGCAPAPSGSVVVTSEGGDDGGAPAGEVVEPVASDGGGMPVGATRDEATPVGGARGGLVSDAGGVFAVVEADVVSAGEMVITVDAGGGVLVLVSAGIESLTVRWIESFAPDAAGFRLRWRERPVGEGEELAWSSVDLDASVRSYTIDGLAAGTRYRLRVTALDEDGREGDSAVAGFETLAPPVRDLTGAAVAHDAVRLSWDGPAGWSPVGYVLQWRRQGSDEFLGRMELPPGRRSQTVEGITGGVKYVFRITARTSTGWQSRPASIGVTPPAAPDSDLTLEVSVPGYCLAYEGHREGTMRFNPDTELWENVYQRTLVAAVPLQWRITGGKAPYTLTVAGTQHTGATGATEVTCARAGLDLMDLPSRETNVVESGPKTLTIEARDATGDTTTRTATIEIMERADTAADAYDGDYLEPGRTYQYFGLFIEIPEGARIAYLGSIEADYGYEVFTAPLEGSRWTEFRVAARSGAEAPPPIGRVVVLRDEYGGVMGHYRVPFTAAENAFWDRFLAHIRLMPFPEGDLRNEEPPPLSPSGGQAAR